MYSFDLILTLTFVLIGMPLDYALTLKGARLYAEKYSAFVTLEAYEMNPLFQHSIKEGRYSIRHLLSLILLTLLITVLYFFLKPTGIFPIIQGAVVGTLTYVNTRHVRNIVLFKKVNADPEGLSGKLSQSVKFSIVRAQADVLSLFIFIMSFLFFVPSKFLLGILLGLLVTGIKMGKWHRDT